MPAFILRVTPARDLYVEWSTVVDNLTRTGTRAEFLEYLAARDPSFRHDPDYCPQACLARVDFTGTSALYPTPSAPFGGWDDSGLIVEQRGILRRVDLEAYVAAMEADDPEAAYALLAPFDDEADEECDRYRAALVELAGEYGCNLRTPPDPSERPSETACRDRRPNSPGEWCYACIASAALEDPA